MAENACSGCQFLPKDMEHKTDQDKDNLFYQCAFCRRYYYVHQDKYQREKKMANKLDSDEFLARLKKIVGKLPCHVDVQIHLHDDCQNKAPWIQFVELAYETCVLFDVSLTMPRFLEMDNEHFDQIFKLEFGEEIKEYKPWDGI